MLNVSHLNVYYGDSHVLRDLSLELAPSESLAIMGRNGMGKTTLLRSLVGMLPTRSGSINPGRAGTDWQQEL
ncbi:ABC transporter [Pseudomonas savastanoi]|uniref:ABC transporter n=1 Tax=Pseudomonas savastanoi TaxID=29438 RepID=A0A3M6AWM4_PSESS|nr:ABC transporter [Pseudomonas syringae pv. cunninghamiae]RMV19621.1 ABC transporter [Pseudomonas savastanoi]RMV23408.1 ABC transporter [Pseudomonas savastanoi]